MLVTFLDHSGFVVEFDKLVLIFDYYKGTLPDFDEHKLVLFLVSHKHQDHFNKEIFTLGLKYKHVSYLLSNDCKMNEKYMDRVGIPKESQGKIHYIHANERIEFNHEIDVQTLKSTDEGVAFIISYDGKVIYHAGDLNWWSWSGEPEDWNNDMTKRFWYEMKKIEGRHFDVAFLPLDPRLEERFYLGVDAFMRSTDTTVCFPMHMWDDFSVIPLLKEKACASEYGMRIMDITHSGEQFMIR